MQFVRRSIDDSLVCLVRDEPVEVLSRGSRGVEGIDDHVGDHTDRMLENLAAFHTQMPDGLGRAGTAVDIKLGFMPPVGTQMGRQYTTVGSLALLLPGLQDDRAR